jgi:hypothetical protein
MIIVNSFLLLTSFGAKTTHRNFRLALVRKLIENSRSLPRLHHPIGRPAAGEEICYSAWGKFQQSLASSFRMNCCTCSARGIRTRVQVKCKVCDVGLCTGECFEVYHKKYKLWRVEECW